MAYIIAEPCIGTKDTACVDVCPVDCIHPAKGRTYDDGRPTFDEVPQLYIDPTECIDCGACVDRKSTRLNSSHGYISYAVFCLKKKKAKLLLFAGRSPEANTASLAVVDISPRGALDASTDDVLYGMQCKRLTFALFTTILLDDL